jgi:hypothetical protein
LVHPMLLHSLFHARVMQHDWVWRGALAMLLASHIFNGAILTYPRLLGASKHPGWYSSTSWSAILPSSNHHWPTSSWIRLSPSLVLP